MFRSMCVTVLLVFTKTCTLTRGQDIEGDLVRDSCIVLPRIMQRLLYTLSYDRKVS
jgi:hypothetical protein